MHTELGKIVLRSFDPPNINILDAHIWVPKGDAP